MPVLLLMCVLASALVPGYARGQSRAISGTVTDTSGVPLHLAQVFVRRGGDGGLLGTLTDSLGRFAIQDVPAGADFLIFQSIVHRADSLELSGLEDGEIHLRLVPRDLSIFGGQAEVEVEVESFDRVRRAEALTIPFGGAAVVRNSVQWETLWTRFSRATGDGTAPPVDFDDEMLFMVSLGPRSSGCSNRASFIREIEETRDSIVVRLGPRPTGGGRIQVTCMMEVHPLEVVRWPRSLRPVVFRGPPDWVPGRAAWWDHPDPEELDRMPEERRRAFSRALARDPETLHVTISHMAAAPAELPGDVFRTLLARPEVRESWVLLTQLAALDRGRGREARRVLFDRFGLELAREPSAPHRSLHAVLQELAVRDPPPFEMSRSLLRHPRVLEDRGLLTLLAREIEAFPQLKAEACREILARHPVWEPILDQSGTPTGSWYSRVPCRDLPPRPAGVPVDPADEGRS